MPSATEAAASRLPACRLLPTTSLFLHAAVPEPAGLDRLAAQKRAEQAKQGGSLLGACQMLTDLSAQPWPSDAACLPALKACFSCWCLRLTAESSCFQVQANVPCWRLATRTRGPLLKRMDVAAAAEQRSLLPSRAPSGTTEGSALRRPPTLAA